jgi:hypothetical protein
MAEFEALRAAYAAGSDADSSLPTRSSRRVISVATTLLQDRIGRQPRDRIRGSGRSRAPGSRAPGDATKHARFLWTFRATGQVKYKTNAADILTKSKTKRLAEKILLADNRKLKSVDQFDHRTMVADASAQELGVSGF